jgi:DNA polymerase
MPILFRDIETRSTVDLKVVGAHRYAADATTGVWCVGYAVNDSPPGIWVPGQPIPGCFVEAARNHDWLIAAHNDAFERAIEQHILHLLGWPLVQIERHRCTMAMTLAAALPAALEKAIEALGLPYPKDTAGQALMRRMAKPAPGGGWIEDSDSLQRLYAYCRADVEAERALYRALPPLTEDEQRLWQLDAAINHRGFHTDGALLDAAGQVVAGAKTALQAEFRGLTGLDSSNQITKLVAWLANRGCTAKDVKKATLKAALRRKELAPEARRAIELRLQLAHASAAKVEALQAWRGADGRVRGTLQYHGAATGRWVGRGPQPQNFRRGGGDVESKVSAVLSFDACGLESPIETVGDIARAMITAAPVHRLLIGDFSGIESRGLAWISGQDSKLKAWTRFDGTNDPNDDPYVLIGRALGHPEKTARDFGKIADLAFGYQGGAGAWHNMAPEDDTSSEATIVRYRDDWRAQHPATVRFWYALDRAAITAVGYPGVDHRVGRLVFRYVAPFLRVRLPSGRSISYPFPRIEADKFGHARVIFLDNAGGKFTDCKFGNGFYGGAWAENVVSGIARDLLAAALMRLEAAGYAVVMHVHDEVVCEAPNDFGTVDEFKRILTEAPSWAEGLPIAAKVRNGPRFSKSNPASPEPSVELKPAPVELKPEGPWDDDVSDLYADLDIPEFLRRDKPGPAPAPPSVILPAAVKITHINITESALAITTSAPTAAIVCIGGGHGGGPTYNNNTSTAGSKAEAEADTYAEEHAGEPFSDAYLRSRGYRLARVFDYTLPDVTVLYHQNRYELHPQITPTKKRPRKRFLPHRIVNGVDVLGAGNRRVIYNWPAIMRAGPGATVVVTEGESNAEALIKVGILATTVLSHGWTPECVVALTDRHVIILEDHDDDGRRMSADARARLAPITASIRVASAVHLWRHLNGEPPLHGDVEDWIKAGGDPAKLIDICREIPADGVALPFINMSKWDYEPVPQQEWTVPDKIPAGECSLFSGEGGAGKSMEGLHLCAAHALGGECWLTTVQQGPAIYVDAEDTERVIQNRLAAVREHYDVTFEDLIHGGLHLISLAGQDAVLATCSRSGKIEPTARYKQLLEAAGDIKPVQMVLASSANIFAGNENDRSQVQQFVSLLSRVAIISGGSTVLISHPSLTGINTGTGLSGTTAWHNSVRARCTMRGIKPVEGEQPDNDLREIVFKKSQHGALADSIVLRFQNGLFLPVAGTSFDQEEYKIKVDDIFITLLRRFLKENRFVSDKPSSNYAPAVFAREEEARNAMLTPKVLEAAMRRLFKAGMIFNEPCGKPSRPQFRIAIKTVN